MSENSSTLATIGRHLALALQPLRGAVTDKERFRALMYQLGWNPTDLPPSYATLATVIDETTAKLDGLDDPPAREQVIDLLLSVKKAYEAVHGIATAPTGVDATAFVSEIGERLFELLLTEYLAAALPRVYRILQMLNVIEIESMPAGAGRSSFIRTKFKWQEIPKIITEPAELPARVYGWGTAAFNSDRFIDHIAELLVALHFPVRIERPADRLVRSYTDFGADATPFTSASLIVPFYYLDIAGKAEEVAIVLRPLPAASGNLPGIVIEPQIPSDFPLTLEVSNEIVLRVRSGTNVATTLGVLIRPTEAAIKYPFEPGRAPPAAGIGVGFDFNPPAPALVFGAPKATRLEFQGASVDFGADTRDGELDILFSAQLKKFALVLAGGDGDSFISSFLGSGERRIEFPFGIEWSRRDGVHFTGSDAFEIVLHPQQRLGPLALDEISFRLFAPADSSADLSLAVGTALSGKLGPVAFSIAGMGFHIDTKFSAGNVGPFDLGLGFKPPTGVGLVIDAAAVVGGGYLSFDAQKGEYAGILQLEIAERIAVKAIGLLTTRLPDGSKGYSLVLLIFVEGFAPIQLGYGFALTGIGGLLGINRTFDEEALRAGLKNHTLDSVMFPQDPVRNAPQILSNLNKVFPPANGHYLFGPMVQIGWPTPALITADLAVVLEFGTRLRLLILAQVVAILPKRENDLVRLQMDSVGVLDFDQGTAALDASLYDSRLLKKFVLTGDTAMRLKWEGSPNFALAVGGLHPAFNPPTNFPKLERIAFSLSTGDNPRIRCEAYFALTANTVQFGARAELYAAASGFSIQGEIGYDVLIQFAPFSFLADFYAQLQLKRNSTNLFKVRVEGALAGPRPLHLKGRATFEILRWDYSIRIDKTLVEGEKPPPPEPIDVLPRLKEALGNPGNWMSQLPAGQRPMVTLRGNPGVATDVLLHPLGTLTVKQGVVPLNMDISRFGQAAPAGARRFTISSVSLGGKSPTTQSVPDFFAPAQFFEMSDDEKLSRPSFEPMPAGVSIGSDEFVFTDNPNDWLEVGAIEFETWIVDKEKNETRPSHPEDQEGQKNLYTLSKVLLLQQARFGAAGNSELRRTGRAKYRTTMDKHKVVKEGWSIVATDDLTVQPVPGIEDGKPRIYSEAAQALRKLKQQNPAKAAGLKILRLSEVRATS